MRTSGLLLMVVGALIVTTVLTGCGGGGGAGGGATVSGRVVDINSGLGIGGLTVTINAKTAISTTPNGAFTVQGIPVAVSPWTFAVTVTPTELFVQVPSAPVLVTVSAGQTVTLAYPVLVSDPSSLPPHPPG